MALFFNPKQPISGILIENVYEAIFKLNTSLEQVNKASFIKSGNKDIQDAINCLVETIDTMKEVVNPRLTETNSTENAPSSLNP